MVNNDKTWRPLKWNTINLTPNIFYTHSRVKSSFNSSLPGAPNPAYEYTQYMLITATKKEDSSNVNVSGVSLSKNTAELKKKESMKLTATVTPSNATDKSVSWSSSNTNVATVSNGKVKAVGEGTATITVKTAEGNKTATCTVIVPKEESSDTSKYRFKDVTNENDYYFKAVEWAAQNGIATGENGLFAPKGLCTREHAVTFIWRFCGKPSPKSMQSKYRDVKDVNRYSYKAILWAHEKRITNAPNGVFSPYNNCLRQEIVTFLHRYSVYIK